MVQQDAPPPAPATPGFTLPSQYLPGFWPLFVLGTIVTLHALMILLQVGPQTHRYMYIIQLYRFP
jgi:hypothetical protein